MHDAELRRTNRLAERQEMMRRREVELGNEVELGR
jgi:hypothetical protein